MYKLILFEENNMKHNKHFLGIILATFSLLITSCSNLLPNMSRNRRRSSNVDESSLNEQSSYEDITSSSNYDKTSSKHRHTWSDWYVVQEATCQEGGIQQRECTVCGVTEQRYTQARGHSWDDYEIVYPATCTQEGLGRVYCVVCGMMQEETIPAYGHQWGDWEYTVEPTCEQPGYGKRTCVVCNIAEEVEVEPFGHDFVAFDYSEPQPELSPTRFYKCTRCDLAYLNFKATEVSEESKKHLVFEPETPSYGEEQGARFWGRPIANDMELNENGEANGEDVEKIFNPNQTGDYFEFVFNLTSNQAALLSDCYLYCDAKPAQWMRNNNMDFFARKQYDGEWTPGYYPSGEREGQYVDDYRYVLFVDDELVYFDPNIVNPVTSDNRTEFRVPYSFSLHAGINKIRLHMAGGYRSIFYNFIFRPTLQSLGQGWVLDNDVPLPKEGEALVKRYIHSETHKVKYEIDVATANMVLDEGSAFKNDPQTGSFKLNRDGNGCSFSFSLNRPFIGKAYQVGYMDGYSSNRSRLLYYQTDNTANIQFTVNGVVTDTSAFTNLTFEQVFGDDTDGSTTSVKEVEIGNAVLLENNVVNFKRVKTMNLTISKFIFIGNDHVDHTWTVNDKLANSALRPMTCPLGCRGYELSFDDTTSGVFTPQKIKQDLFWNVTDIEPGKYEVHFNACAVSTTLSQDIVSNGTGRYVFRFNEGDYVSPNSGTYQSYGFGTGTSVNECQWTNSLCELIADSNTTTFSIHYGGQGYSAFVSGVRLVRVS